LAIVALGGNALITPKEKGTIKQQKKHIYETISHLKNLSKKYKLIITHGNGPQVGDLLIQQKSTKKVPEMPLDVLGAMTQGQLGYLLQKAIQKQLKKRAVTVITQILVDPKDKAFRNPTKPIGPYYKNKIEKNMIKEPEGWRKVVPSPKPKKIIEINEIKSLVKNFIVIACGGGGIPVTKKGGVEAVIDKDLATELLAIQIKADLLIFLTDVDYVYLNYRKKNQRPLKKLTVKQVKKYMNHFKEGSMKPKIEASINFLKYGKKVIITKPKLLDKALKGKAGTMII
ncbi:MAG: carbamate kinase, partial [Candidatus Aenigmatarchaeota archaeon]